MNIRVSQIAIATLLAASLAGAASAEQYVFTDDTQAGFFFNSNTESWQSEQWYQANAFLVDTDAETVSKFGRSGIIYESDDCKRDDRASDGNSYMACHSFETMTGMFINRALLRFARTFYAGYTAGDQDRARPLVAISTCAELGS